MKLIRLNGLTPFRKSAKKRKRYDYLNYGVRKYLNDVATHRTGKGVGLGLGCVKFGPLVFCPLVKGTAFAYHPRNLYVKRRRATANLPEHSFRWRMCVVVSNAAQHD